MLININKMCFKYILNQEKHLVMTATDVKLQMLK